MDMIQGVEQDVPFDVYVSYGQILVRDCAVALPASDWTDAHTAQGFARRSDTAQFATLIPYGAARVNVHHGVLVPADWHERVIRVPMAITSGCAIIEGPEVTPANSSVNLPAGFYRVYVAQGRVQIDDEGSARAQSIEVAFERVSEMEDSSSILVCDAGLHPPPLLLESAEVAGGSR